MKRSAPNTENAPGFGCFSQVFFYRLWTPQPLLSTTQPRSIQPPFFSCDTNSQVVCRFSSEPMSSFFGLCFFNLGMARFLNLNQKRHPSKRSPQHPPDILLVSPHILVRPADEAVDPVPASEGIILSPSKSPPPISWALWPLSSEDPTFFSPAARPGAG